MKIGDKVRVTEKARDYLFIDDDEEFTIVNILEENVQYKIVINSDTFGKDWVQFVNEEEIIFCN